MTKKEEIRKLKLLYNVIVQVINNYNKRVKELCRIL